MNTSNLNVTLIQTDLFWEDKAKNLAALGQQLQAVESTDLLVLPEMFSTGFSMNPQTFAEQAGQNETLDWMRSWSQKKQAVLVGSFIVAEDGKFYNRLHIVRPDDATVQTYDKRHLFRMANEDQFYGCGKEKLIFSYKGWKICPLICYDLRFPVWSRNKWTRVNGNLEAEYDVLIYPANWPERRSHPWKSLLVARAIENQAYVLGVNRIGEDGNGIAHSGDSAILDFKGEYLAQTHPNTQTRIQASLSYKELMTFRENFPAGMDADDFSLR
ncbi:MAG: amidohydrolase [Bacteroidia bacterium]